MENDAKPIRLLSISQVKNDELILFGFMNVCVVCTMAETNDRIDIEFIHI